MYRLAQNAQEQIITNSRTNCEKKNVLKQLQRF